MSAFAVILAAAGKSTRFNDAHTKKPFMPLDGKAVWVYSAERFLKHEQVKQLIVVVSPEDFDEFQIRFEAELKSMRTECGGNENADNEGVAIEIVKGGTERADSVGNGLAVVREDCEFVAIHDAARPCIDADLIDRTFNAARNTGAAVPCVPVNSTIKRSASSGQIESTVDRSGLFLAQTPQVFRLESLRDLYRQRGDQQPTDESSMFEAAGLPVSLVEGSPFNIKITSRRDLDFASACLKAMPRPVIDVPAMPQHEDDSIRKR